METFTGAKLALSGSHTPEQILLTREMLLSSRRQAYAVPVTSPSAPSSLPDVKSSTKPSLVASVSSAASGFSEAALGSSAPRLLFQSFFCFWSLCFWSLLHFLFKTFKGCQGPGLELQGNILSKVLAREAPFTLRREGMRVRSTKLTLRAQLLVEASVSDTDAGAKRTVRWRCHGLLDVAIGIASSNFQGFRALGF